MKLGMVGLPNVGKSTLFNVITNAGVQSENYPFCTIDPNIGVTPVIDERLDVLSDIYSPKKIINAVLEIVDIAGLVKGASVGEGLGNKFLSNIREVDAIIHVVRCFDDDNVVHVDGNVDAKRDVETINIELIMSDIEIVNRRIEKAKKLLKSDKNYGSELEILENLKNFLEDGNPARAYNFSSQEDKSFVKSIGLISFKPVIYLANLSESDFANGFNNNENYKKLKEISDNENAKLVEVCAKFEEELADMSEDDKKVFLSELNLDNSGLVRLIKEGYDLLGLISYFTAGKQEVRAWTINRGTKAPQAASKIHTDFERGFIKAEVVAYDNLVSCGSMAAAKEKGLVRLEGKDYVVNDGDIMLFRFNV